MNKLYVQTLNECLGIDGPIWIEDNPDSYIPLPNTYFFNSDWQRELARKNAIERNKKYKGANNPRAKTWRIVYADGREVTISGLQRWAVNNGYSASGIKKIAYGHWKTYRDLVTVEEVAQART